MKKTFGVFAHVDAGKTTLSEQLLYRAGATRKAGRIEEGNTCLDFEQIERERGITVYSSVARFFYGGDEYFLIDTPGHTDFSAEAENAMTVPDFALMVVSGTEGVQSHTQTLWRLLKVPVFIFVSKTDRPGFDRKKCLEELKSELDERITDFCDPEAVAQTDEELLNCFLTGESGEGRLTELLSRREIFPCFFGSSLTGEGIEELMNAFSLIKTHFSPEGEPEVKIFKIRRDRKGNRLCFLKVTKGTLLVKGEINGEKVDEIRLYEGGSFTPLQRAEAGTVCAVCGITAPLSTRHSLLPVMRASAHSDLTAPALYDNLKLLEDENPLLNVSPSSEISFCGEIQLEALTEEFERRFSHKITFSDPDIIYKETLTAPVIGLGHYEPLRHYGEVILKLEPMPPGSEITFESSLSTDSVDKNVQNLIRSHVFEQEHRGALTGSPVTDIKITLLAAKTHLKHTEGGDLRQATLRAIRQGLVANRDKCKLLEPLYAFVITVPLESCGRLLSDLQRMNGDFSPPIITGQSARVEGRAAVSEISDYQRELASYSGGKGTISLHFDGYADCRRQDEVIKERAYNPEADTENPCGSVFCARGAGFFVPFNEVHKYINSEIPTL